MLCIFVLHDFSVCDSVPDNKLDKCIYFLIPNFPTSASLWKYYTFVAVTQFLHTL